MRIRRLIRAVVFFLDLIICTLVLFLIFSFPNLGWTTIFSCMVWDAEMFNATLFHTVFFNFHEIFLLVGTNFRGIGVNYRIFQVMHGQHLTCASLAIYADWARWRATLLRKNQTAWRYKCLIIVIVIVIFVNVFTVIIVIIRHIRKGELLLV